jgi:hypothetical protein
LNSVHLTIDSISGLGRVIRWSAAGAGRDRVCVVGIHGAGLEPTHALYLSLAEALVHQVDVWLPFLSASHFLAFHKDFRKPLGWCVHDPAVALEEVAAWITAAQSRYQRVIAFGHSWGGYVLARATASCPAVLLSPIESLSSLVETNLESGYSDGAMKHHAFRLAKEGAPFPLISRSTVDGLLAQDRPLRDVLAARDKPLKITYGEREHPLISQWIEGWQHPFVSVSKIRGVGHFYGGRGELLSPFVLRMEEDCDW